MFSFTDKTHEQYSPYLLTGDLRVRKEMWRIYTLTRRTKGAGAPKTLSFAFISVQDVMITVDE